LFILLILYYSMNNIMKSEILKYLYKNKTYQLVSNDTIIDYYKNAI